MNELTDLTIPSGWWRDILKFEFQGVDGESHRLALAVRNGYLNAYVEGQSILKIQFDDAANPVYLKAKIHHKYLGKAVGQVYKIFDGKTVEGSPYLSGTSLKNWVANAQEFAKLRSGSIDFSEKQGVAVIASRNSHVIDLEMALPGEVAPRIDLVALERGASAIKIVFYEAKLFSNPALRAKNCKPKVLEQLRTYEEWLTSGDRKAEVIKAYRNACGLLTKLREMQGVPVDGLIEEASIPGSPLTVDPKPRLIIFGPQTIKNWTPHEAALRQAGITGPRLIIEKHPKDVELPKDTRD